MESGKNSFVMTPTKWISKTNAIGIKTKAGKYSGGTFAHRDIALEFASWISAEVKLYIIKDGISQKERLIIINKEANREKELFNKNNVKVIERKNEQ